MKKLVLLALVFSPMFAQADITCKSMQTGEIVTIETVGTEAAGSVQITRLGNVMMDVPASQVVDFTGSEEEVSLQALDAEMKNTILKVDVKRDAGPLFPAPRKGVYWGKMNHSGTTIGLRCELK